MNVAPAFSETILNLVRNGDDDITLRQMSMLLLVYSREEPYTPREMAANLAVAKPVISRAMDKMEELGVLRRLADPRDGRSVLLGRTPFGEDFMASLARATNGAKP